MDDKVLVQRANVVLSVSPQQLDYYKSQGFDVINEQGEVVQASVPRDLGTLQKAYVEDKNTIEGLQIEIADLKKKLKRATSKKKEADSE